MMEDLTPIKELKTYDLFITKIDENNIIKEYSIYEEKYNMDIPCIVHLKIECEELGDYANNYKLVNGEMVELTEEEKPIVEVGKTTKDKVSILTQEVVELQEENKKLSEMMMQVQNTLNVILIQTSNEVI